MLSIVVAVEQDDLFRDLLFLLMNPENLTLTSIDRAPTAEMP